MAGGGRPKTKASSVELPLKYFSGDRGMRGQCNAVQTLFSWQAMKALLCAIFMFDACSAFIPNRCPPKVMSREQRRSLSFAGAFHPVDHPTTRILSRPRQLITPTSPFSEAPRSECFNSSATFVCARYYANFSPSLYQCTNLSKTRFKCCLSCLRFEFRVPLIFQMPRRSRVAD